MNDLVKQVGPSLICGSFDGALVAASPCGRVGG
jgi:hypothetical protein